MTERVTGRYENVTAGGEVVSAFVPNSLPPRDPPLPLQGPLKDRLRIAELALARLDSAGSLAPSQDWLVYAFVRAEAVISSQIEGTQASLTDLLEFEADKQSAPTADLEEVCNCLAAIAFARQQLADAKGLPISMRLLNQSHRLLMKGVRGADKNPGEIRRSQNWIGGSRPGNAIFVPPPHHLLPVLLSAMEKYIHSEDALPPLIRTGLLHAQFETIHPYLDGNGRIGRLLIILLLEDWGLLNRPLLYLSVFFKRHQREYYRRLDGIRVDGSWEDWLDFFLDGVAVIAVEAEELVCNLFGLVCADRDIVLSSRMASVSALRLLELLPHHPIVSVDTVMGLIDASRPTASRAISTLEQIGILSESTGRKRNRSFVYRDYLEQLRISTDVPEF